MSKGIEWLKGEIGELPYVDAIFDNYGSSYIHSAVPVKAVYELIDQLDEPETNSQIDKLANFIMSEVEGEPSQSQGAVDTAIRIIKSYQNQETLSEYWIGQKSIDTHVDTLSGEVHVPFRLDGPEKPVIPKFVAEWIEELKPYKSLRVAFEYIARRKRNYHDDELAFWVEEGNSETLARAWLDGYIIANEEEEPLYRARLKVATHKGVAAYLQTRSSDAEERLKALEIGSKYIHEDYQHLSEFTEEELKRLNIWDSDQWEVEELEE